MRYYLENDPHSIYQRIYKGERIVELDLIFQKNRRGGSWKRVQKNDEIKGSICLSHLRQIDIEEFIANHFEDIL